MKYPDAEHFLQVRPCLTKICRGYKPAAKLLAYIFYRAGNCQESTFTFSCTQDELIDGMCDEVCVKTLHNIAVPVIRLLGYADVDGTSYRYTYTVYLDRAQEAINLASNSKQLEKLLIANMRKQLEVFPEQLEKLLIELEKTPIELEKLLIPFRKISNSSRGRKPALQVVREAQIGVPQNKRELLESNRRYENSDVLSQHHAPHPLYDYVIYDDIVTPSQVTILMTGNEEEDKARVRTAEGLRHAFVLQEQNVTFLFQRAVEADTPIDDTESHSQFCTEDVENLFDAVDISDDDATIGRMPAIPKGHTNGHDNIPGIGSGRDGGRADRPANHGGDVRAAGKVAHAGQETQQAEVKGHDNASNTLDTGGLRGIQPDYPTGSLLVGAATGAPHGQEGVNHAQPATQPLTMAAADPAVRGTLSSAHAHGVGNHEIDTSLAQHGKDAEMAAPSPTGAATPAAPLVPPAPGKGAKGKGRGKPAPSLEDLVFAERRRMWQAKINERRGAPLRTQGECINETKCLGALVREYTDAQIEQVWHYLFTLHWKYSKLENKFKIGGKVLLDEAGPSLMAIAELAHHGGKPAPSGYSDGGGRRHISSFDDPNYRIEDEFYPAAPVIHNGKVAQA